jgi:quercetin dioxygenase-like cupin family protein
MIKRAEDMVLEIKERMRGGEGRVLLTHLLKPGEFQGKSRLIARLMLSPGCSIGYHDHQNEEEILYVLSGQATLTEGPDAPAQILRPGDVAVTLGGEGHFIRNDGELPLELLAMVLLYS